jgi:hypothetical protein
MREDATSSEDVLQLNQRAPTMCKCSSKGVYDQCVLQWRTPADRDEKTGMWRHRFLISIISAKDLVNQVKHVDFGQILVNLGHHLKNLAGNH